MKILITLMVGLLTFSASAKKIKGYIVDNGDTTQVVLYVKFALGEPSIVRNYDFFKYSITEEEDNIKLYPREGVEVLFKHKGKECLFRSLEEYKPVGSPSIGFVSTEYRGKSVSVVSAVRINQSIGQHDPATGFWNPGGISKSTWSTLYSSSKGYLEFGILNFRKAAKAYFSDCPELVDKIAKKEVNSSTLDEIVDFYDQFCVKE